jgi:hypothetical protein
MRDEKIPLGATARDTLSGYVGVCTGRFLYLYGCVRIELQAFGFDKYGKPKESIIIDELRAEFVSDTPTISAPEIATGGPAKTPQRASPPRRS